MASSILVQNDLRPAYYDDFHCLAGDCCWNCCQGWHITFTKKEYLSLKHGKYSPELSARMEHSLQRIRDNNPSNPFAKFYAEIRLPMGGSCPLQQEDGLCALQVEKGVSALPYICTIFPRTERYSVSGFFERSLSLACEGVAALLWNLPEGIDFRSDPLPKKNHKELTFTSEAKMLPYFQDIRSVFIDYLQDRRFPLPSRILMIGLAIQELQSAEDIPRWLAFAQALPKSPNINQLLEINHSESILHMFLSNNLKLLINILSPDSKSMKIRSDILNMTGLQIDGSITRMQIDSIPYLRARDKYADFFADRDYFMENIMVALFFDLKLPALDTPENLWKSYISFCNLYSFYRFMTIFSCREGVSDPKAELFQLIVMASRSLLHNGTQQAELRDELFENDSTSLAHMAVLLSE